MRIGKWLLQGAGILFLLIGALWIGQGSGVFPYPRQSFMIGQTPWLWRGAALVFIGVVMIVVSRRMASPAIRRS